MGKQFVDARRWTRRDSAPIDNNWHRNSRTGILEGQLDLRPHGVVDLIDAADVPVNAFPLTTNHKQSGIRPDEAVTNHVGPLLASD